MQPIFKGALMAKPKVFVSSTYYDLRHNRGVLEAFITQYGYDAILFEKGSIFFRHDQILEQSCLAEVEACDILILVIGGRYGSLSKMDEERRSENPDKFFEEIRSITRAEYEKARDRGIPIFIFVEDGVLSEYRTFLENRDSTTIKYAHVDDRRIYAMLNDIYVQRTNNFVRGFSTHEDILDWLREQWAGLFADALRGKQSDARISSLESQILELANVVTSLKSYSEEIVRLIDKSNAATTIEKVNKEFETKQKIDLFRRNRLIQHLSSHVFPSENLSWNEAAVMSAFSMSTDFLDFLEKLDVSQRAIARLKAFPVAKEDYKALKAAIIGEMNGTSRKKRGTTSSRPKGTTKHRPPPAKAKTRTKAKPSRRRSRIDD